LYHVFCASRFLFLVFPVIYCLLWFHVVDYAGYMSTSEALFSGSIAALAL